MTNNPRRSWLRYIRAIRKAYPPPVPVRIRVTRRREAGVLHLYDDHAHIYISESLAHQERVDTLVHEYAHLLNGINETDEHGETWGCWYARVYQVVARESDLMTEEQRKNAKTKIPRT